MGQGSRRSAGYCAAVAAAALCPAEAQASLDVVWRVDAYVPSVWEVRFSRDGTFLASLPDSADASQPPPACDYWDAASGESLGGADAPRPNLYAGLSLSATEDSIALMPGIPTGRNPPAVYSLDGKTRLAEFEPEIIWTGWTIRYSPSGDRIACVTSSPHGYVGELSVFDAATGGRLFSVLSDDEYRDAAWSRDGTRIACGSAPRIVDSTSGEVVTALSDPGGMFVDWGSGDAWVVSAGSYGVVIHDAADGHVLRVLDERRSFPATVSPDGLMLASALRDADGEPWEWTLWRTSDWRVIARETIEGLSAVVQFSPDSRSLVFGLRSGEIMLARTPRLCPADCDRSSTVDAEDFVCFQAAWRAREAYADFDASGRWDVNDFIAFYGAAITPCP